MHLEFDGFGAPVLRVFETGISFVAAQMVRCWTFYSLKIASQTMSLA
jgi:hypothetical protein